MFTIDEVFRAADVAIARLARECIEPGPGPGPGGEILRLDPSDDEQAIFDRLAWDDEEVSHLALVVHRMQKLRHVAGTRADRDAAHERLARAESEAAAAIPVLRRRIETLEAQIHALERARSDARRWVREQQRAIERRAELVIAWIRDRHAARHAFNRQDAPRETAEIEGDQAAGHQHRHHHHEHVEALAAV